MNKKQKRKRPAARNNGFMLGALAGAAVAYVLLRNTRPAGPVTFPSTTPVQLPVDLGINAGRQYSREQYNPFHYLPGDLGRQLPAIYLP
jgi:uncharacterized membrane protein